MITNIQAIFFSPTKTTKKTINAIIEGTKLERLDEIDLTLKKNRDKWDGKVKGDLLIIGTPVYASTIPEVYQNVLKTSVLLIQILNILM